MKILRWLKNSSLFNYLRSGHDSIRYKFFNYPLDQFILFFNRKILKKSWVEFYSGRLDNYVINNNYKIVKGYDDWGLKDLDFLKKNGLLRHHKILDFGCGFGRCAVQLVPYLKKRNYYGLEISNARLEVAKEKLKLNNIKLEDCVLIYNNSNSNISNLFLNDEKFDYIYLNSVFTHTPYKDIDDILKQFKKILNKNGKIIFSAHLKERNPKIKKTIKDFYYSYDELSFLAKKNNLRLDELLDWPDNKCPMFRLQLY